jgi:isoleucyl-tRNA synthetase
MCDCNNKKYPEVNPKQSFPHLEKEMLEFWKDNSIFEKSIDNRE